MGMFISHPSWIKKALYKKGGWEHLCNFGKGNAGKGKGKVVLKELRRWRSTVGTAPYRRRRESDDVLTHGSLIKTPKICTITIVVVHI